MEPQASPAALFARSVNFILGAGILGIPHAITHAGFVTASACLILVTVLSALTCSWLLEVSDRANALQNHRRRRRPSWTADEDYRKLIPLQLMPPLHSNPPFARLFSPEGAENLNPLNRCRSVSEALGEALMEETNARKRMERSDAPNWSLPEADISALEISQLCHIFLGPNSRLAWLVAILLLHVAAMWACAAIWVESALLAFDTSVPSPLPTFVCAAVYLPLCLLGGMPRIMAALALTTLLTITAMIALLFGPIAVGTSSVQPLTSWNAGEFGPAFATFVFSCIVQQSMPSLLRVAQIPSSVRGSVCAALAACCALYLLLGSAAAVSLGTRTAGVITFNFRSYATDNPMAPAWVCLIARWATLLPLVTTSAAYPLFNEVLASNLLQLLPQGIQWRPLAVIVCAVPPMVLAALIRNTQIIFSVCGLSGFVVSFFMPALLQEAAKRKSVKFWGEAGRSTPNTTVFSSTGSVLSVLLLATVAFVYDLSLVVKLLWQT